MNNERTDSTRIQRLKHLPLLALAALMLFLTSGCTATLRNSELEKVAKDWSLVIRASQVIPVYPLTEDLQPGDVLLVSNPIEEQAALYKKKGFLPLDQHMIRLYSKDFKKFYGSRFGTKNNAIPPAFWQTPDDKGELNWKAAPHAGFPSYQFSAKTGSGLNLAVPIQGVPVALGLMHAGSASGTVTIADAYTYGLDIFHLEKMVRSWGIKNRKLLRSYAPRDDKYHFLRVVSRVYVTGRVNVTVNNDETTGGEARGGADRPIDLIMAKQNAVTQNYSTVVSAVNRIAADQLPGGKVKFAIASSRSVTFSETFERPLVIGYIGFDMPILTGGRMGAPISTLAQLDGAKTIEPYQGTTDESYRLAAITFMYEDLKKRPESASQQTLAEFDTLVRLLPQTYPFSAYEFTDPVTVLKIEEFEKGAHVIQKSQGFRGVLEYLGYAETTVETLRSYLATAPLGSEVRKAAAVELGNELKAAEKSLRDVSHQLYQDRAVLDAIDRVFLDVSE